MMNKIALVTDSSCDLPVEIATARGIEITPMHVIWGQTTFTDGIDITAKTFYERLSYDPVLPKTSQPAPGEFAASYRKMRELGADSVVCVTASSILSGTYTSARTAGDLVDFPVRVVDSRV